jgi:iron complex transport system substrate-binding protein
LRPWLLLVFSIWPLESFSCSPAKDATRVAVAGGSITEIIYFLGEEKRLIAVDQTSNYPLDALKNLPSLGYVRNLSAEGILSLSPTLVLGEHDMGPIEVLSQLDSVDVEVIRTEETHDVAGILNKVSCVADVLGVREKADFLVAQRLESSVQQLVKIQNSAKSRKPRVALVLSFSEGSPIVAGTNTSGHGVLEMSGLENVFSLIEGWKPVSFESMIEADPQFIVLTERSIGMAGGIDKVKENPAIKHTSAARQNRIFSLDGMSMLGFGPRTLDAALSLSKIAAGH